MGPYRTHYGAQHMLKRLLEEWRANLEQNKIIGAVLLDLSKVSGCFPSDLLTAKLNAYGFDRETLRLIYSYQRKETVCTHQKYQKSNFL